VIRLAEMLADPESNGEAREDIRSLIGEVAVYSDRASNLLSQLGGKIRCFVRKFVEIIDEVAGF
jgi:hypothetical protein